tara:strand:- start:418 stop:609 length:192 start_codon:yes stop_codon:yes gene_type:complete
MDKLKMKEIRKQVRSCETNREKLIDKILELSGDEFETILDYIELAKETDNQLEIRLKHIKNYE